MIGLTRFSKLMGNLDLLCFRQATPVITGTGANTSSNQWSLSRNSVLKSLVTIWPNAVVFVIYEQLYSCTLLPYYSKSTSRTVHPSACGPPRVRISTSRYPFATAWSETGCATSTYDSGWTTTRLSRALYCRGVPPARGVGVATRNLKCGSFRDAFSLGGEEPNFARIQDSNTLPFIRCNFWTPSSSASGGAQ